jgi:hypothetical protein
LASLTAQWVRLRCRASERSLRRPYHPAAISATSSGQRRVCGWRGSTFANPAAPPRDRRTLASLRAADTSRKEGGRCHEDWVRPPKLPIRPRRKRPDAGATTVARGGSPGSMFWGKLGGRDCDCQPPRVHSRTALRGMKHGGSSIARLWPVGAAPRPSHWWPEVSPASIGVCRHSWAVLQASDLSRALRLIRTDLMVVGSSLIQSPAVRKAASL